MKKERAGENHDKKSKSIDNFSVVDDGTFAGTG
jgi:hypothetical protein